MNSRPAWKLVLALALGVLLAGWLLWMSSPAEEPPADTNLSRYQTLEGRWEQRFEELGSERAYEDFVREASRLSYSEAHELSHIIGEVLFKLGGEKGIGTCTADFAYGCYHGFAGAAFARRGLSIANELENACNDPRHGFFLGCLHGVGHGVLSYLGNEKLAQALETCRSIQKEEKIGGCFGGVFMEYNFNTMQSPDGIKLRAFNASHPDEPCPNVSAQFRSACYYELPSWWRAGLNASGLAYTEQLAEVGKRCEVIQESDHRGACYRGVGNVIGPLSEYRATLMREWCSPMPDTEAFDVCFREALGHLLQSEEGKKQLRLLCASGSISYKDFCRDDL